MESSQFPALIFDLDGTLLDTEFISEKAIQQITLTFGKALPWSLRVNLLGRPSTEWTRMVIDELNLHEKITHQQFSLQWEENMKELFHEMLEMPNATVFLRNLYDKGVPLALATSSSTAAVTAKRKHHEEMFSYFSVIVCGDDPSVVHGKPAPDIFLVAAQRLLGAQFDPSHCIVFEDSIQGVLAGYAAGMQVVAIPDSRFYPTEEERRTHFKAAHYLLNALSDFDIENYRKSFISESVNK